MAAGRGVAPRLASSSRQLLAVADAVHAVLLVEPAEAYELGDGLVHALSRRADHGRQLLLSDRQLELVALTGQLEQALRRAPGYVEEHRVGQRFVDGADAPGQQLHDAPQGAGLVVERLT